MNGVHDLGGMQGFGPVRPEPETEEPVFHQQWEGRVYAMVRLIGALELWNLDMTRRARESLPPADYLAYSYYEIWFAALRKQLVDAGLVSEEELQKGKASSPICGTILEQVMRAEQVQAKPFMTTSYRRPTPGPTRFVPGDRVLARNRHPRGHTREPRYVRGHVGTIDAYYGSQVYPDLSADGVAEGRHLYSVRFAARELWGESADVNSAVYVDLWEDYLEAAP